VVGVVGLERNVADIGAGVVEDDGDDGVVEDDEAADIGVVDEDEDADEAEDESLWNGDAGESKRKVAWKA
jgi:hypothetical protein